ncbi:MAG: hypothetical protein EOP45_07155 [Sphingobacteriaceae bacterium]|nr:MAG: hypothetical protein EOP45_07155 [Sphingobacteriaceae bacterium]
MDVSDDINDDLNDIPAYSKHQNASSSRTTNQLPSHVDTSPRKQPHAIDGVFGNIMQKASPRRIVKN